MVTPGTQVCTPEGCVVTPPIVTPGSPGYVPSNATLSSGQDSGSDSTGGDLTATRPTPRQSETDVGGDLGPGHTPQVSYIDGQQVPYGTAGSVRPDFVSAEGAASL
jgi:filamentous hemagglutinin